MPIAASQKDNQVRYRHILPKPPGYPGHLLHHHHNSQVSPTSGNVGARYSHDSAAILPELGHLSAMSAAANSSGESFEHFFSTHSPPILNLSPNLSPTEPQRTSPFYDLRETTRRRSLQGKVDISCIHLIVYKPTSKSNPQLKRECEDVQCF